MSKPLLTFDRLPVWADDDQLGEALFGRDRKRDFADLAPSLEPLGLPRINPLYRGRYTPAVEAFFRVQGESDVRQTSDHGTKMAKAKRTA